MPIITDKNNGFLNKVRNVVFKMAAKLACLCRPISAKVNISGTRNTLSMITISEI
jgi:hypothetical protein